MCEPHAGTTSARFCCEYSGCTASFSRRDRLVVHHRTHTGDRPFACVEPGCERRYTRSQHLRRHVATAHAAVSHAVSPARDAWQCPVPGCGRLLSSRDTFVKHQRCHRRRVHRCDVCLRSFIKRQHLRVHQYQHTGVKPFICPHAHCTRSFLTPSRLRTHQRRHERTYTCDHCHVTVDTWRVLVQHKRQCRRETAQRRRRRFPCDQCDAVLPSEGTWRSHVQTHCGEQQRAQPSFSCSEPGCQRRYFHRRNLTQHVRVAHQDGAFVCPLQCCGRRLASRQRLRAHVRLHRLRAATATPSTDEDRNKSETGSTTHTRRRPGDVSVFTALTGHQPPADDDPATAAADAKVQVKGWRQCPRQRPSERTPTVITLKTTTCASTVVS